MDRLLKVLAVAALVVTIAAAGTLLYGLENAAPVVQQIRRQVTPAQQAGDTFDTIIGQIREGRYTGNLYAAAEGLLAEDCLFETYTLRLTNRGLLPAEWISAEVIAREGDLAQLPTDKAYVLGPGKSGDISVTVLRCGSESASRGFELTCYVAGKQLTHGVLYGTEDD